VVAALAGAALLALALALAAAALLELALALAAATTLLDDGLALAAVLEEGLTLAGMTLAAGPAVKKVDACGLGPGEGGRGSLRQGPRESGSIVRILLMLSLRAEEAKPAPQITGETYSCWSLPIQRLREMRRDSGGLATTVVPATVLSAVA
jgi:hypothetical protein